MSNIQALAKQLHVLLATNYKQDLATEKLHVLHILAQLEKNPDVTHINILVFLLDLSNFVNTCIPVDKIEFVTPLCNSLDEELTHLLEQSSVALQQNQPAPLDEEVPAANRIPTPHNNRDARRINLPPENFSLFTTNPFDESTPVNDEPAANSTPIPHSNRYAARFRLAGDAARSYQQERSSLAQQQNTPDLSDEDVPSSSVIPAFNDNFHRHLDNRGARSAIQVADETICELQSRSRRLGGYFPLSWMEKRFNPAATHSQNLQKQLSNTEAHLLHRPQ